MRKINLLKEEQHIFWKTVKDSQADKKKQEKTTTQNNTQTKPQT